MTQCTNNGQTGLSEEQTSDYKPQPSFHYQMVDMKARKIATLIKFSKLPYSLEEVTETQSKPFIFRTHQGELFNEYQIIGYAVTDSFTRTVRSSEASQYTEDRPILCPDIFSWAKINQRLIQLRKTLFPMLEQFYRYLFGHESVRKSKYEALNNKIRKQILKIDNEISQHNQMYGMDYSFINIILACQLFLGYKLVFDQKFRKSKSRIFNKCEKIYKSYEFQEIYGKVVPCVQKCQPVQFDEEQQMQTKKEDAIKIQLAKLVEPWVCVSGNQMRNQLLYNFFRNTFKGQDSKNSYFPYFWLMYQNLLCSLVELTYQPGDLGSSYSDLEKCLDIGANQLGKIMKKDVDYGFLGLYYNQKERQYRLQGLFCIGESPFDQFSSQLSKHQSLKKFKPSKLDVHSEEQRHKVQVLWQYQTEGTSFDGIKVMMIRQF